jgi:SulP family sulfate permease
VIAVSVGFVLAAILFMRRMAEITQTSLTIDNTEEEKRAALPKSVSFYEVNGPLFFGAAQRAMEALHASSSDTFHVLVLHLGKVPVIDATGFAALESAVEILIKRKKRVIIAGPLPEPRKMFEKAKLERRFPAVKIVPTLAAAMDLAHELALEPPPVSAQVRAVMATQSSIHD